jgi:hypothetical protein
MVSDPGTFTATLSFRNGRFGVFSATKALEQALEKKRGLDVTALLSYQSARGGSPVSRTVSVDDKLTKPKAKRAK